MGVHRVDLDHKELELACKNLENLRVGIFVLTYNAENFISSVLERIPEQMRALLAEIYIIDDSSKDQTTKTAIEAGLRLGFHNLTVLRTPFNRGYGGNQKLGYLYAIQKNLDVVVMLHGDGQYPPEYLPQIINSFVNVDSDGQKVDAVFASRMIDKASALKGKMPFYKWIGNQVLTNIENFALGSSLSEFHSGYRAYRVSTLKALPFQHNSNVFHFDTEIIIQLLATNCKIHEISIPTHYGDEVCHVNGIKYALDSLMCVVKYYLTQIGLFYQPNFDFKLFEHEAQHLKQAPNTLHQFILNRSWPRDIQLIEIGARNQALAIALSSKIEQIAQTSSVEFPEHPKINQLKVTEDDSLAQLGSEKFDAALMLDVIDHYVDADDKIEQVFKILKPGAKLYISSGNIAYLPVRLGLAVGQFNYGKRGILDNSHVRLFTIYSLKKLLSDAGFIVRELQYFGPPIVDMIGNTKVLTLLDNISSWLARLWPSLFAYSFLVVAERTDSLESIYQRTVSSKDQLQ